MNLTRANLMTRGQYEREVTGYERECVLPRRPTKVRASEGGREGGRERVRNEREGRLHLDLEEELNV